MTQMKICTVCQVEKPITDFYKDSRNPDGHRGSCKECTKRYNAALKAKKEAENPESVPKKEKKAPGRKQKPVTHPSQLRVKEFEWTTQKMDVAYALADGKKTKKAVCEEFGITPQTLSNWLQHTNFKLKVEELVLTHDLCSRIGLIKMATATLEKKLETVADDKTTALEWAKFQKELLGLDAIEPTNEIKITINAPTTQTVEVEYDADYEEEDDEEWEQ
jgi:transposase-like protein